MGIRSITAAVPAISCLALTICLSTSGCGPGESQPPGEPNALWPRMLDAAPRRTNTHVHWLDFGKTTPNPVAIHPDGHLVALETRCETIVIDNNSLELRDFHSGEVLAELEDTPAGAGLRSRYSLDGRFILTSKYPGTTIHVRDPRTLEDVKPLKNDLPVRWYQLTPNGRFLLAGQQYAEHRNLVAKWELDSGRRLWSHAGPSSAAGEFSETGRYYLTKSGWNLWALWDTEAGQICCVVVHRVNNLPPNRFKLNEEEMSLYVAGEEDQLLWSGDSAE